MSKPLRLVQQIEQPIEFRCPLCCSEHAAYSFSTGQLQIFRCGSCALTFSKPLVPKSTNDDAAVKVSAIRNERDHAMLLAVLDAAKIDKPVLVVADPQDELIPLLEQQGIPIGRVVDRGEFGPPEWGATYPAVIISAALMRVPDPRGALVKIRRHLAPGALLLLSVPLLDGAQARLMGRGWHEWVPTNRWYFTRETLNLLLLASGFEHVWFRSERRNYSLDTLSERMHDKPESESWLQRIESMRRLLPKPLHRRKFPLPSGTGVVSAVAASTRTESLVSIVVPVFNEHTTFNKMMDALLTKQLSGMRKEIILIESNSTDGSRELVRAYEGMADVRIVLQSSPRGKGNAVREGLALATGDIIMIQDADLEYDLDDYDGLLAPLAAWQAMFILGSRHQGGWKMRKFADAPMAAAVLNLGHWFFKSMMNVALGTRMTDPFTMFKVFRRDAIYGIDFVCNRFDFDIELVIKLVRKGYVPLELPVNYSSRSFKEGKKVSFTRDGMTWVWTILKMRFSPIGRGPA